MVDGGITMVAVLLAALLALFPYELVATTVKL
jgi:hypothetical protein